MALSWVLDREVEEEKEQQEVLAFRTALAA
jgi:hypothetical protein